MACSSATAADPATLANIPTPQNIDENRRESAADQGILVALSFYEDVQALVGIASRVSTASSSVTTVQDWSSLAGVVIPPEFGPQAGITVEAVVPSDLPR